MQTQIIIPVTFFAAIFGILYVYFTNRTRERLALIEKGESADLFFGVKKSGAIALKFGMLFIGISVGILIGHVLEKFAGLKEEVAYFSMILLFGGLALIGFYFLDKYKNQSQKIG